jgi:hypothetical protein
MKTLQDVFNTAAPHLLKQKQRSGTDKACLYRDGPLKCAVGVLIADEHYHPDLEEEGANSYLVMQALSRSGWPEGAKAEGLYYSLQTVHDDHDPKAWAEKLASVAKTFNLDASCLNTESLG